MKICFSVVAHVTSPNSVIFLFFLAGKWTFHCHTSIRTYSVVCRLSCLILDSGRLGSKNFFNFFPEVTFTTTTSTILKVYHVPKRHFSSLTQKYLTSGMDFSISWHASLLKPLYPKWTGRWKNCSTNFSESIQVSIDTKYTRTDVFHLVESWRLSYLVSTTFQK